MSIPSAPNREQEPGPAGLGVIAYRIVVVLLLGVIAWNLSKLAASKPVSNDLTIGSQFKEHAKQVFERCKERVEGTILNDSQGNIQQQKDSKRRVKIEGGYEIVNVRKTDSVLRPFAGKIRILQVRETEEKPNGDLWNSNPIDVTIESQFEDGSWNTSSEQIDRILLPKFGDKGRTDGLKWEYRSVREEGAFEGIGSLGEKGWEVYAVAGGQPYVASFRTTKGPGETMSTTNEIRFTPTVWFLKRPK